MKNKLPKSGLYLCLSLLLYGCASPSRNEKPSPFIPPQTMQEIMTEHYLLEATLRVCEREHMENASAYGRQQWDSILHKYHITNDIWKKNYYYYMSQSHLSDSLLVKITDKLTALELAKSEVMKKEADTQPQPVAVMEESDFGELIFN